MPEYYDSYYDYNEYEYDPNADYDEYDESYAYLDDCDDDNDEYGNSVDDYPVYHTEIWKQIRLTQDTNNYVVHISNRGRVKPDAPTFQQSIATNGTQLHGTPYMITRVGSRDYYIHELVWRAFVGPIQSGYEVRHRDHYVQKRKHSTYSNRVECLEVYSITVERIII